MLDERRETREERTECHPGLRAGTKDEWYFELSSRTPFRDRLWMSWRPAGSIGSIAVLFAIALLSACTDYVSKIDDQIAELKVDEPTVNPSSSAVIPGLTGNLLDTRDGQTYKTVTIGTQTWMAQNLNYETVGSFCYNNNALNCTKYGRLYIWTAAKVACFTGWHLPTKAEFEALLSAVGDQSLAGIKLKSTSGWIGSGNGLDVFSFSALPAGRWSNNGGFDDEGYNADFWSSTENTSDGAYYMILYYNGNGARLLNLNKNYGFSVRCVKD